MNFSRTRKRETSIELTPLIDVVFLLLIFFMVSSTLVKDTALSITLPETSVADAVESERTIDVLVDAIGRVAVNDLQLATGDREEILDAIAAEISAIANPRLAVRADAQATHESVVRVLDIAKELGLIDVSIQTQNREATANNP